MIRCLELGKQPLQGFSKGGKGGVGDGVKALLFDEFPQPFDQIEIRRIGGKKQQFDAELLCDLTNQSTSLIFGIVHNDGDGHRKGQAARSLSSRHTLCALI